MLAVSCSSSGPANSAVSSPPISQLTSPSPSPSLAANKSCPGANPAISTDQPIEALTAAHTAASAESALQSFLGQFQLKAAVLSFLGPPSITWENLNDDDLPMLIAYGSLVICELAKYSQGWVDSSGLKRVALVKHLGRPPTTGPCALAGLADFYRSRTVYFSVECTNPAGLRVQRRAIHHEFWHVMEASIGLHDPAWAALNDPGFSYGASSGYDPLRGWGPSGAPPPRPGFVTAYAMYSTQEDQAETYASLFVKEDYALLATWIATDAILNSKVNYIRQLIVSIDSTMNKAYLEHAAQS
jgi:hypothetical protein